MTNSINLALKDFRDGVCSIHIWPMLAWLEIKQRYRRSLLGPLWLTISTGAMLGGMGPLYGRLLNLDIGTYFPYLSISFVVWLLMSSLINDACVTFISAEGFIKQVKAPLFVYVMRTVWRNLVIFGHNLLIVLLVLIFWPPALDWHLLMVPLGVLAIAINGIWLGALLGLVCARYRDIPQIVTSLVQIAFFLTPVMWKSGMLGRNQWAAEWNPFYHFLEIVRAPLIEGQTNWPSWTIVVVITVCGYIAMAIIFARYRARVAYWV